MRCDISSVCTGMVYSYWSRPICAICLFPSRPSDPYPSFNIEFSWLPVFDRRSRLPYTPPFMRTPNDHQISTIILCMYDGKDIFKSRGIGSRAKKFPDPSVEKSWDHVGDRLTVQCFRECCTVDFVHTICGKVTVRLKLHVWPLEDRHLASYQSLSTENIYSHYKISAF